MDHNWLKLFEELKTAFSSSPPAHFQKMASEFLPVVPALATSIKIDTNRLIPFDGNLSRSIWFEHIQKPFFCEKTTWSRFAIDGGSPVLYFAANRETALAEKRPERFPTKNMFIAQADVSLKFCLDLTTQDKCNMHGIMHDYMRLEWEFFNDILEIQAYSQYIGQKADNQLIEGILYESVRNPGNTNLIVFPGNMRVTSSIQLQLNEAESSHFDKLGADRKSLRIEGQIPDAACPDDGEDE